MKSHDNSKRVKINLENSNLECCPICLVKFFLLPKDQLTRMHAEKIKEEQHIMCPPCAIKLTVKNKLKLLCPLCRQNVPQNIFNEDQLSIIKNLIANQSEIEQDRLVALHLAGDFF